MPQRRREMQVFYRQIQKPQQTTSVRTSQRAWKLHPRGNQHFLTGNLKLEVSI